MLTGERTSTMPTVTAAAVAATAGLMAMLDRHEVEAVMAHELAHVANRDTLIMTVTATVALIVIVVIVVIVVVLSI